MPRAPLVFMLLAATTTALATGKPTFDPARLSAEVKMLSSDEFEGRAPATPGETKTVAYVIAQMRSVGLQPGGDLVKGRRSWTQAVPLGRYQIKGPMDVHLTTSSGTQSLTQGTEIAVRAALNGSKSVSFQDLPLVFIGYGVKAPERHWDDFKGVDLHNKIAVVLVNDPDFETGSGDFGGKAMTYYGRWTYKFEEAARQGAVGMLIVHETDPAAYGWATVKNSNTTVMFDVVRADPAAKHPAMEAWIQRDFTIDLFKRAGLDFEALKKQAQTRDFHPVVLSGVTLSANYAVDAQVITSRNIVGRLAGTKFPDENVIYSAHWDHFGSGEPDAKGDRIYNGAVDNGTGTASLIELARAFVGSPRPQRSVLFLNVTAEERGLLGSEYYASNPVYPLSTTVGVINIDALHPTGPARNFSISGSAKLDLLDDLIATAKTFGLSYSADPHPEAGHFFRSDHFPMAKRGVPAISYESGNDWEAGGVAAGEASSTAYTRDNYHQPSDEWHADWAFTGMVRDLQVLYTLGNNLANSRQWPNWPADSEFRATRDASAAQRH